MPKYHLTTNRVPFELLTDKQKNKQSNQLTHSLQGARLFLTRYQLPSSSPCPPNLTEHKTAWPLSQEPNLLRVLTQIVPVQVLSSHARTIHFNITPTINTCVSTTGVFLSFPVQVPVSHTCHVSRPVTLRSAQLCHCDLPGHARHLKMSGKHLLQKPSLHPSNKCLIREDNYAFPNNLTYKSYGVCTVHIHVHIHVHVCITGRGRDVYRHTFPVELGRCASEAPSDLL